MVKSKFNSRGFTLVELIVVIAIMGVILILALPQVSKIQSANKAKKYEAYKGSFTSAAKIYIDNHKKDLFGNQETGCVTITYDQLKQDNLIKNFSETGVNCNYNNESKVDVTKDHDQYYYSTNITCTKDGKQVYQDKDSTKEGAVVCGSGGTGGTDSDSSDCDPADPECCKGEASCPPSEKTSPSIYATPSSSNNKWYTTANIVKQLKLKFVVADPDGLNKNISIQWTWKNEDTKKTSSYSHDFKNNANKGTTKLVLNVPEKKIPTETGHYSVVISPKSTGTSYGVQDFLGNVRYTSSKIFEKYQIDNVKPTMSPTIVSKSKDYNSLETAITISGDDDVGVYQMYISNEGPEKGGEWVNYQNVSDWKLDGEYDGGERTVYITIKDYAGNKVNATVKYTVYKSCTDKVDDGSWYDITSCSAPCGDSGTKTQQIKRKDKYLGVSCGTRDQSDVACNRWDCCSQVTYTQVGQCSKACGGGRYKREAYSAYNKQRCSAKDDWNGGSCNTQTCCSASNLTGCEAMYVCKGATYFHQTNAYSTGSQTLLPWAKVYILDKNGNGDSRFYYVYVDSSQPHTGKWGRYNVGYIDKDCLAPWSNWNAYLNSGYFHPYDQNGKNPCYHYIKNRGGCTN